MKLKFLMGVLLFSYQSSGSVSENLKTTLLQTCEAAEVVSVFVATHMALALLHEGAHVITAKAALSAGAETVHTNSRLEVEPFNAALCPAAHYPIFKNGIINALVDGIPPLLGIAAVYATLQATNVAVEYTKDHNFKRAWIDGLKKELINSDQPMSLRAGALFHAACNGLMIVPFKISACNYESDGYKVLKHLMDIKENK